MNTKRMMRIAMIAAIYTVLCIVPGLSMISYGQVQVRIAEALTLLPLIYKPSIVGVTLGCFLANLIGLMTGVNPTGTIDLVVGTLATFLAANCTYLFRNRTVHNIPVLSMLMPVIFNFIFIGLELAFILMPDNILLGTIINGTYVAIGELIAVIIGYFLIQALKKTKIFEEE